MVVDALGEHILLEEKRRKALKLQIRISDLQTSKLETLSEKSLKEGCKICYSDFSESDPPGAFAHKCAPLIVSLSACLKSCMLFFIGTMPLCHHGIAVQDPVHGMVNVDVHKSCLFDFLLSTGRVFYYSYNKEVTAKDEELISCCVSCSFHREMIEWSNEFNEGFTNVMQAIADKRELKSDTILDKDQWEKATNTALLNLRVVIPEYPIDIANVSTNYFLDILLKCVHELHPQPWIQSAAAEELKKLIGKWERS
jgi:hypothetical protein